ncbi:MAG: secondary thiamine-phosphate synthase enzyme YjbQ [Elusimicrobiota bacterium]|nr:secondary thiamine-phosphate synthase enzyme YjbQ [Elusimicrobiota bacterium]
MKILTFKTNKEELLDITSEISTIIRQSKISNGICHIYVPHTTCGLAINENADPDVKTDILGELREMVNEKYPYRHAEGNSTAHIKSTLTGNSLTVFIENNSIKLGTWQGIFLCEFDGPRTRNIWIKILKED